MLWHHQIIDSVIQEIQTSVDAGLSSEEAKTRLNACGPNSIRQKGRKSGIAILIGQFKDFMIIVLIIASIISGFIGEITDTIIILVIVILNALIGFIQEFRAEKVLEALKKMASPNAQVVRNGIFELISADTLVPGDIVILEAGNVVPADIRIAACQSLQIDESVLTGESIPVSKVASVIDQPDIPLGDRFNMAYKSTMVTGGRGKGVVVATGMQTEMGNIADLLQVEDSQTPLQVRLDHFGKRLTYIVFAICILFFVIGLFRGEEPFEMLLIAIAVAVAAIPEALPAVVTISLAIGAKRLSKQNVVIRKLPAVETLGSVSFICSDKTGTLTQNKMSVTEIYDPKQEKIGQYFLLELCIALNNETHIDHEQQIVGDPTEVALVKYVAEKLPESDINGLKELFKRTAEVPFDAERKRMTTLHEYGEQFILISKGAVESIVNVSDNSREINQMLREAEALAKKGIRVLAFAYRIIEEFPPQMNLEDLETGMKLCGLAGLQDPPRPTVYKAIKDCKTAGITPVMITGDHPATARAIASQIGLLEADQLVVSANELQKMSEAELLESVDKIGIYARVSPEDKLDIVKAIQKKGHFLAMTGDGINDAPALKRANIGIAMGITGTDVSKEAADMILMDDNFATIVGAVKEGRRIFDNILKFIKYTMTSNSGEIWTITLAPLFGLPIPLLAVHILWINLVTDGLPGLALAVEPPESNLMKQSPRHPKEHIFSRGIGYHILFVGLLMGIICLAVQAWSYFDDPGNIGRMQTMVFTVLSLSQLGHAFAVRSHREFIFKRGLFSNKALLVAILFTVALQLSVIYIPYLNDVFHTVPLSMIELTACLLISLIVFHVVELEKWLSTKLVK